MLERFLVHCKNDDSYLTAQNGWSYLTDAKQFTTYALAETALGSNASNNNLYQIEKVFLVDNSFARS